VAKHIFTFGYFNIKCSRCGVWLKAGESIREIVCGSAVLVGFIGLGYAYLKDIYNWELGLFNVILILTIFVGIPSSITTWKYGAYEVHEPKPKNDIKHLIVRSSQRLAIAVFGIVAIGFGISILYNFFNFLMNIFQVVSGYGLIDDIISLQIIVGLGLIISGYGLLRFKPWARYSLLIHIGLLLWAMLNRIIIIGISTFEYYYLIHFIGIALFLWFFNRKSIKGLFPYYKNLRHLSIVWITILTLEIAVFAGMWFEYGYNNIPKLQEAVYQSKDEDFYLKDYSRTFFPLKYTLALPKNITFHNVVKDDEGAINIVLTNHKKYFIGLNSQSFLMQMLSDMKNILGYDSHYHFAKKLYSERYGMIFTLFRSLSINNINKVEEAEINNVDGFVEKSDCGREFHLFRNNNLIGSGSIRSCKSCGGLSQQQMDEIIGSIKYQDKPVKSAQEFFEDGLRFYNGGDIEKAKLSFASALCLDWENSQYHYYLGDCFFQDESWDSAKEHIEKALSLQPDYFEAKTLLEKIKNKQKDI